MQLSCVQYGGTHCLESITIFCRNTGDLRWLWGKSSHYAFLGVLQCEIVPCISFATCNYLGPRCVVLKFDFLLNLWVDFLNEEVEILSTWIGQASGLRTSKRSTLSLHSILLLMLRTGSRLWSSVVPTNLMSRRSLIIQRMPP